jgi:hypothetical protein
MYTGLSLDQAPPLKAPLKFFLTAPLFSIAAGILFLVNDSQLLVIAHLITIGFIIMTIFGSLLQMLPVVAGAIIKRSLLLANTTYGLIVFGLISFMLAFTLKETAFYFISAGLLFSGLFLFSYICIYKLFNIQNKSWITIGMIFSLLSFIIAFLLGILLFLSYGTGNFSPFHHIFANLHYNIIFFGFIFLLVASISFQVIPMFWVSAPYKEVEQKMILISTVVLLLLYLADITFDLNFGLGYRIFMGFICLYFSFLTIKKLYYRKRKLKDTSVYFYFTSMVFLSLGVIYWVISSFIDLPPFNLGVLFGLGFIISLMNGMLYKIVPFLTWFHLSSKGIFDIPTMREMISRKKSQFQYIFHILSIMLLFTGFLFDNEYLIRYGVILFIISNLLLFTYLISCAKLYFLKKEQYELNTLGRK